jgi:cyclopropane fatty-acyl-phospholipid synthase-like methyltransferase
MDKEFIKLYFGKHWTSRTKEYKFSNHSIAKKIPLGSRVIDIGCGNNEFKPLIPGLVGIDIVNTCADIIIDFDEFITDEKFDVALCLGSIQYGTISDIDRQLNKLSNLLVSNGLVFWRTNTGVRDHNNNFVNRVPYYHWTKSKHFELAEKHGFTVKRIEDDLYGRLYAEWIKQ